MFSKCDGELQSIHAPICRVRYREQPKPQEEVHPDKIQIFTPCGTYHVFRSPLHEAVPHTSGIVRYSIDFPTVHSDDAVAHLGVENVRLSLHGTTMVNCLRCSDLAHLPETLVALYEYEIRKPWT